MNNNNKERVLTYKLATELSTEELNSINGGAGISPSVHWTSRISNTNNFDVTLDW